MKEATGELNMTVVTVVAIAAVAAFFYAFVWPSIKGSITSSTKCATAVNCRDCDGKTCKCTEVDEDGHTTGDEGGLECPDNSNNGEKNAG